MDRIDFVELRKTNVRRSTRISELKSEIPQMLIFDSNFRPVLDPEKAETAKATMSEIAALKDQIKRDEGLMALAESLISPHRLHCARSVKKEIESIDIGTSIGAARQDASRQIEALKRDFTDEKLSSKDFEKSKRQIEAALADRLNELEGVRVALQAFLDNWNK